MTDRFLARTVVVTTVRMDEPDVVRRLPAYRAGLPEDEQVRARRYLRDEDRDRFVVARALVRQQLSRFGPLAPSDWRFVTNGHGRPEIANPPTAAPRLRFNLSHTRGLVACAVTGDREVGVDVEYIDRRLTHDVATRFFAAREVADLHALDTDAQALVFFDYWTLKEAYIKARGLGLALPLGQFAFRLAPPGPPVVAFDEALGDEPASWQFFQSRPSPRHRLALAVRRTGADLDVILEDVVPRDAA